MHKKTNCQKQSKKVKFKCSYSWPTNFYFTPHRNRCQDIIRNIKLNSDLSRLSQEQPYNTSICWHLNLHADSPVAATMRVVPGLHHWRGHEAASLRQGPGSRGGAGRWLPAPTGLPLRFGRRLSTLDARKDRLLRQCITRHKPANVIHR